MPVAESKPPAPAVDEDGKRGRLGRKRKKVAEPVADAKQSRVRKSAPEAGMEDQDVSFMQDLSSRLSAYSISPDEPVALPPPLPAKPDDDADADREFDPALEPKPDYLK